MEMMTYLLVIADLPQLGGPTTTTFVDSENSTMYEWQDDRQRVETRPPQNELWTS